MQKCGLCNSNVNPKRNGKCPVCDYHIDIGNESYSSDMNLKSSRSKKTMFNHPETRFSQSIHGGESGAISLHDAGESFNSTSFLFLMRYIFVMLAIYGLISFIGEGVSFKLEILLLSGIGLFLIFGAAYLADMILVVTSVSKFKGESGKRMMAGIFSFITSGVVVTSLLGSIPKEASIFFVGVASVATLFLMRLIGTKVFNWYL